MLAEFKRMGARAADRGRGGPRSRRVVVRRGRPIRDGRARAVVRRASAGSPASRRVPDDKVLLAPLPSDLDELAAHPLVHEKLMPVLGLVRSPSVEHGDRALRARHRARRAGPHLRRLRDRRGRDRRASPRAIRTGRILVNAPTAVGALGGVYNSMTPTFSLGCGTWGGSMTTDNVNYRNLLNIKTVSRRQAPPQWFRVPSDTYFNPARSRTCASCDATQVLLVTDADTEARGVADEVRSHLADAARARVLGHRAGADGGADPRRRRRARRSCGPT